jgi:ferredoxin
MAGAAFSYGADRELTSANDKWQVREKSDCIGGLWQASKDLLIHSNTMADREDKNSENVSGKFYVDSQCIDCDLCRETAPNNFARAEDEGYSYVFKQPENDEETAQCREAMEGCPVEAIGDDGDE